LRRFVQFAALIALAGLAACAGHVRSAQSLITHHDENLIEKGIYADSGVLFTVLDAGSEKDRFCMYDKGNKMLGDIRTIAGENGILIIASNIVTIESTGRDTVIGDFLYMLRPDGERVALYDPVNEALDAGIDIPFVQACEPGADLSAPIQADEDIPENCLIPGVSIDAILTWFDNQQSGEKLVSMKHKGAATGAQIEACEAL